MCLAAKNGPIYLLFLISSKCQIDRIELIFSKCWIEWIDPLDPLDITIDTTLFIRSDPHIFETIMIIKQFK